jgi:6-phosphogluconate dehydrogenase (decarboxylating)
MKSVGVIGLGRFGKVLVNILQKGYLINAYDINDKAPISNVN